MSSSSHASYLPEVWKDDVTMHGLMSVIKERGANKVDYDRKIKFWTQTIFDSCIGERDALFDISSLKRRFRRGDRVPASLNIVVDEIRRKGDIVTLSEWKDKHSGWIGWGLSKTRSWMFGGATDTERLIHLPTVKKQSADLLKLYNDELRADVECTGEVVTYSEMFERARDLIATPETFDICLEYLTDIGEITVGATRSGEKILKFKDLGTKGPLTLTEADTSVVDIRKAMSKLDREIRQLEEKILKYDEQCRKTLRAGEKGRAQNFLRQKKRAQKDVADKDAQYQKLLAMLHQLANAKNNKEVLNAYQSGTAAFKATLARQGMTPDKIHNTMDEVANSLDEFREIEEAMSTPLVNSNGYNDDDLEQELNELMNANKDDSLHMPDAPTNRFGLFDSEPAVENEQEQLEKRLARLRETA